MRVKRFYSHFGLGKKRPIRVALVEGSPAVAEICQLGGNDFAGPNLSFTSTDFTGIILKYKILLVHFVLLTLKTGRAD